MAVPAYNDFFNYLKKEIGKRNFYEFFLEVLSHNKIAISLYKKLGFQEIPDAPQCHGLSGSLSIHSKVKSGLRETSSQCQSLSG